MMKTRWGNLGTLLLAGAVGGVAAIAAIEFMAVVNRSAKHVIVIGVDGLGSAGLREAATPRIDGIRPAAAWTVKARGVIPTVSSPNWASMIMGAGPEQHGVTSNEWQPAKFDVAPVCQGSNGTFPTMFEVLRRERPAAKIAVFHDWDGFGRLVEPGVAGAIRHVKGSVAATEAALEHWKAERPALLFLHLDDVDHAGHQHGWKGPEYRDAVLRVDGLIGRVWDVLGESGVRDSSLLLITADHGGVAKSHGGISMEELEIPWIVAGAGVKPGEINARVNTYDTAATVVWALGAKPHPCWTGRAVREAFK